MRPPTKNEISPMSCAKVRGMSDLPATDEAQHQDDDHQQHRQHEQRDGRAVRHVAGHDAGLKTGKAEHLRRADRDRPSSAGRRWKGR